VSDRFLTLVRHGEVVGGGRFRGPSDEPLTEKGSAQVRSVFSRASGWDQLFSSPARRCREPAAALAELLGVPLTLEADLAERDFGAWSGCETKAIPECELLRFYANPLAFAPPGAEPLDTFARRVGGCWSRLLEGLTGRALVLTHGGVIRVLIAEVLQIPLARLGLIEVPHACVTRIRVPREPGLPSIMSHGALD
jgi:broad specificity phosphatase PhoE